MENQELEFCPAGLSEMIVCLTEVRATIPNIHCWNHMPRNGCLFHKVGATILNIHRWNHMPRNGCLLHKVGATILNIHHWNHMPSVVI